MSEGRKGTHQPHEALILGAEDAHEALLDLANLLHAALSPPLHVVRRFALSRPTVRCDDPSLAALAPLRKFGLVPDELGRRLPELVDAPQHH